MGRGRKVVIIRICHLEILAIKGFMSLTKGVLIQKIHVLEYYTNNANQFSNASVYCSLYSLIFQWGPMPWPSLKSSIILHIKHCTYGCHIYKILRDINFEILIIRLFHNFIFTA